MDQRILMYCGFSLLMAFIGRKKRFGFWGYLFSSLLFTPIIGFFLVLASDPRKPEKKKV